MKDIILIILTLNIIACGQPNNESKKIENEIPKLVFDTSKIAILQYDTVSFTSYLKPGKPADLTNTDIEKIEALLNKCISEYNPNQEKQYEKYCSKHPEYKAEKTSFIIDLNNYNRQYVAVINSKGEKEVWINCFCQTMKVDARLYPVIVFDGGNCFFNLKVNLTTGIYYDFTVNDNG